MTTVNIAYATSTSITCTAPSTGNSRISTAVDNTSNKYDDAMVTVQVAVGTVGSNKIFYIYIAGTEDGTNYNVSTGEATYSGTDAAITIDDPTSLKGPQPLPCPASSKTYNCVIGSVASFFGGTLPRKWAVVVNNQSNVTPTLTVSYTGITYTNA